MNKLRLLLAALIFAFFAGCVSGQVGHNPNTQIKNGMVVSASKYASDIGVEIMRKGGNAVDAAVAVHFALAVVYPNAGNLGGGGFLVYRSAKGEVNTLDFREMAPGAASRDMYLDEKGDPIIQKSLLGSLAAGVPGAVDGMYEAHKRYGKLDWAELIQPSIDLAQNGFKITPRQSRELNSLKTTLETHNLLGTALLKESGKWEENDLLIQNELGATLKLIRDKGKAGFYEGVVADMIVEEMQRSKGIITHDDLKSYKSVWRDPITGWYRGHKIITMPPPSSGGIALIQLLRSVEPYNLKAWGHNSDSTIQLLVEAERRVYADRATHLGDPDYYNVPAKQLIEDSYIRKRMGNFSFEKASKSEEIQAGKFISESEETTHFSIVDREGNAVSLTTTLNGSYGSAVVVKGAGFLLNNEMDDFSVKPGSPNMYGLVGGEANAIAPYKRMLSSMTPTILEKDGKLFMVVGTPGGSTIITSVFQTILNVIDFGKDMQSAVSAKKFHHQWLPDLVDYEPEAVGESTVQNLTQKGYVFRKRGAIGRVDAILINNWGYLSGGADPRGDDAISAW